MSDSKPQTELELSAAELKLVTSMRQVMSDKGTGPKVVTVVITDGIWQVWRGQHGGIVKDVDK